MRCAVYRRVSGGAQQWENYPVSPIAIVKAPYQVLWDNPTQIGEIPAGVFLACSISPFGYELNEDQYIAFYFYPMVVYYYHLVNGKWEPIETNVVVPVCTGDCYINFPAENRTPV